MTTGSGVNQVAVPATCRNCNLFLGDRPGNFCANCGQVTVVHPPTFREFVHEFITHYVALEGALWRTLGLLFFIPGELTRAYLAGRKQRYVSPLRLYITASFLFFLVVKFFGWGNIVHTTITTTNTDKPPVSAVASTGAIKPSIDLNTSGLHLSSSLSAPSNIPVEVMDQPAVSGLECGQDAIWCQALQQRLEKNAQGKSVRDVINNLRTGAIANLPYAIFFMLPLFALLTKAVYWRRGLYYGEHMVYAFHVHAFTFFVLLLKSQLPRIAGDLIMGYAMIYYLIAMQRVFGGRWWLTLLRYGGTGAVYSFLLVLMTVVVLFASVLI